MTEPSTLLAQLGEKCRALITNHDTSKDPTKLQALLAYSEADQEQLARRLVNLEMPWDAATAGLEPVAAQAASGDSAVGPGLVGSRAPAPTALRLDDIIIDSTLQVRLVDEAVAAEYAEHLDELPPVNVMDIDGANYLVNGFHRHRAHELKGAEFIEASVQMGTMDEARLFVAQCDTKVGVRRTREAKRAAVLLALSTSEGMSWSDREVARHCGVSHTLVSNIRSASGNVATYPQGRGGAEEAANPESGNVATQLDDGSEPVPSEPNTAGATAGHDAPTTRQADATPESQQRPTSEFELSQQLLTGPAPDPEPQDEEEVVIEEEPSADGEYEPNDPFLEGDDQPEAPTMSQVTETIEAMLDACSDDHDRIELLDQFGEWYSDRRAVLVDALEEEATSSGDENDDGDDTLSGFL